MGGRRAHRMPATAEATRHRASRCGSGSADALFEGSAESLLAKLPIDIYARLVAFCDRYGDGLQGR